MRIDEYITHLRKNNNIIVAVQDNELKIKGTREALTKDIIEELRKKKPEILEFFRSIGTKTKATGIQPAGQKAYYDLSFAQQRLYFLHQFDKKSLAYNVPQVFELSGNVSREKLERAFRKLIARHETLRTYFEVVNGQPVQKVSPSVEFEIEYYHAAEAEAHGIISKFIRPFELEKLPLMRVGLIGISSGTQLLMIDMHHILTDGVSVNILSNDFMAFYNGEELPELQLQYKDYAEWQQSEEQKQERERRKTFWLSQFAGELPPAELPYDFQRPLVKSFDGSSIDFSIDADDTTRLHSIAEVEGATLFMVVLSIFNILLAKLSNEEDVVIGIPTAGRQHADLENIIGMFVNTLPLRNYPKGDLRFKEFLSEVKNNTLACIDNQSYPYEELIDQLKLERDTSRNPLFDVMFAYQNFERTGLNIPGLALKPWYRNRIISKFDLTLTAVEATDRIFLNMEYATALFTHQTVKRFISYFKKIVAEVIANADKKISDISLLSDHEQRSLVHDFNQTAVKYPRNETVISLFEKRAQLLPEGIALKLDDETMTYAELKKLSDKIASYLRHQKGIKPGDLAGIMLEREAYLVPCILGVLKAGAAYVPIDPAYPEERIKTIIDDSQLKILITRKTSVQLLHGFVIDLDQEKLQIESMGAEQSPVSIEDNSLAYVIYTSGSTGKPKGVMIGHRSLSNYINWAAEQYTKGEKAGFALYTSISFDLTVTSIFVPLVTGNTVFIYNEHENNLLIERVLLADEAEVIKLTPAHLRVIRDSAALKDHNSGVKRFIVGGEQLDTSVALSIHEKYKGNIEIYNEYGPTEATVGCMIYKFDPREDLPAVPIGIPAANTRVYLLDRYLQPVATGVQGELCVAGEGLARGYFQQPLLTRERFIDNPFITGTKMYRTGDLAMMLPNGNIVYKCRLDDQVKVRGYRIELGEIKNQLAMHEEIEEAVVIVKQKEDDKYLIAYYISAREIGATELRGFLSGRVPEYMVPAHYVHLRELPLTANGKLNKKALPLPQFETGDDHAAASGDMEEKLVGIWSEVLGLEKEKISVKKTFFELGGNSLKIVRLHSMIKHDLNWDVTLPDIFRYPTISSLTDFISREKRDEEAFAAGINEEIVGMEDLLSGFAEH